MVMGHLHSDSVSLLKTNGEKVANLWASVQGERIFMQSRLGLRIEEGDLIQRSLSNGTEELYRVIDPGFYEGRLTGGPGYQMQVRKLAPADAASAIASAGDDQISDERRNQLFAQWNDYGLDAIKADLNDGGFRIIGGPPATRALAREWVRMKESERAQQAERAASHTIHISGANARVNLHSTDNSTNTVVSHHGVFGELHHAVDFGVTDTGERAQLKTLIDEMAAAKDRPTFVSRYQAFIANAANHMTLFAPMLPGLTHLIGTFAP